jgi:hypothetical protein
MYNFGRVTPETGPERYCDSSEMGIGRGCLDDFSSNSITLVRGNKARRSGQKSAESARSLSLPESATKFPRITPPTLALGKSDDRHFRLAPKTKRKGNRTDAPIDIELHSIAQPEQAVHVLDSHIR